MKCSRKRTSPSPARGRTEEGKQRKEAEEARSLPRQGGQKTREHVAPYFQWRPPLHSAERAKRNRIEGVETVESRIGGATRMECERWSLGYFFTLPQKGWDWERKEDNGVLSPQYRPSAKEQGTMPSSPGPGGELRPPRSREAPTPAPGASGFLRLHFVSAPAGGP